MPTATADPTDRVATHIDDGRRWSSSWGTASVDASSYVAFRVAFGLVVVVAQVRFVAKGWVGEFFLRPEHHLRYAGTDWLPAPSPLTVWVAVATTIAAGLAIAAGRQVRGAAVAFVVAFGHLELVDAALYLNHYWFVTLAAVLLAVLPDPVAGRVPMLNVVALRAQLGVVYVFAGIAKLNADWLLRAEPLSTWLPARSDRPIIGPLLELPVTAFVFSWAGMFFDLTVVAWLLWRRTRPAAYVVLVAFHVATAMLFQIGVFPWVMIALTPIFFAPDWPRRTTGRGLRWLRLPSPPTTGGVSPAVPRPIRAGILVFLAVFAAANVVVPLRHLAAEGDVRWNDDGYLLSWRVLLTERVTFVEFEVTDPDTGNVWVVLPGAVLDDWQEAAAMRRPDLILATAHLVAHDARAAGVADPEVRALAWVSWNGRPSERWLDPTVDLATVDRIDPHADFVLPEPDWSDLAVDDR